MVARKTLGPWLVSDLEDAWDLPRAVAQQVILQVLRAVHADLQAGVAVLGRIDEPLAQGARTMAARIEFALGRFAGKDARSARRAKPRRAAEETPPSW